MADLGEIIVVDTDNHRVMAWRGCEGRVVAGGTEGSELDELCAPCGVALEADGSLLIADCGNARVMRWRAGATASELVCGGTEGTGLD